MKRYLFELICDDGINYHQELFECDADAMIRAREILKEGKRDANAFVISVYKKNKSCDWKHIISYQ